jgi:hypothetical protein
MYWLWAIALTLLLALGLFSWLVVVPVWRTRAAVMRHYEVAFAPGETTEHHKSLSARTEIEHLGGEVAASRKLAFYLRLPTWITPNRDIATSLLCECGDTPAGVLVTLARDDDRWVRLHATMELARRRDLRALQPLFVLLKDRDADNRQLAAEALGEIGDPRAIGPLEAVPKDDWPPVSYAAAQALKKIKAAQQKGKSE